MEAPPKPRKRDKFIGWLGRSRFLLPSQRENHDSNANEKSTPHPDQTVQKNLFIDQKSDDTQRTKERYVEAVEKLRKAVNTQKRVQGPWMPGEFDSIKGEPESYKDLEFRKKLDKVFEIKNPKVEDQTLWERGKGIMRYLCHTLAPFAKNFLTIAKEGAAVFP